MFCMATLPEKKITISLRFPILIDRLVAIEAARRTMSKSELVEIAIRRLLKVPKGKAA